MRDERLFHINIQTAEDQRSRIRCGSAPGIEIYLFADEVVQVLNLRPDEDVQFRRE